MLFMGGGNRPTSGRPSTSRRPGTGARPKTGVRPSSGVRPGTGVRMPPNMRLPPIGPANVMQALASGRRGAPPHSLQLLDELEKVYVTQPTQNGVQVKNKYFVRKPSGEQLYIAIEESNERTKANLCTQKGFGFDVTVYDRIDNPVLKISRDFKCLGNSCCWCSGCCNLCAHSVTVESPAGTLIGYVQQLPTKYKPEFGIFDENRKALLTIKGPSAHCFMGEYCCSSDDRYRFAIFSAETKLRVGLIGWQFGESLSHALKVTDNFGVAFPADLDTKTKALVLGAYFFIDLMYFENKTKLDHHD